MVCVHNNPFLTELIEIGWLLASHLHRKAAGGVAIRFVIDEQSGTWHLQCSEVMKCNHNSMVSIEIEQKQQEQDDKQLRHYQPQRRHSDDFQQLQQGLNGSYSDRFLDWGGNKEASVTANPAQAGKGNCLKTNKPGQNHILKQTHAHIVVSHYLMIAEEAKRRFCCFWPTRTRRKQHLKCNSSSAVQPVDIKIPSIIYICMYVSVPVSFMYI